MTLIYGASGAWAEVQRISDLGNLTILLSTPAHPSLQSPNQPPHPPTFPCPHPTGPPVHSVPAPGAFGYGGEGPSPPLTGLQVLNRGFPQGCPGAHLVTRFWLTHSYGGRGVGLGFFGLARIPGGPDAHYSSGPTAVGKEPSSAGGAPLRRPPHGSPAAPARARGGEERRAGQSTSASLGKTRASLPSPTPPHPPFPGEVLQLGNPPEETSGTRALVLGVE